MRLKCEVGCEKILYNKSSVGKKRNYFPNNPILHKETPFYWTQECDTAFRKAKETFQSNEILAYYDSKLPLLLVTDANPYGVGAVFSHVYLEKKERYNMLRVP